MFYTDLETTASPNVLSPRILESEQNIKHEATADWYTKACNSGFAIQNVKMA